MSLPNATRDTTEHPGKYAVPAPVDKREQAADIDRKVSHPIYLLLFSTNALPRLAPLLRRHRGIPTRALSLQSTDRRRSQICP